MLRGLRLPGKLTFAAVPLVLALVALTGLLVQESLVEAQRTRATAVLAGSLDELSSALAAPSAEAAPIVEGNAVDDAVRTQTDAALADFEVELQRVGAEPLRRQFDVAIAAVDTARTHVDGALESGPVAPATVAEAYEPANDHLLRVAALMSTEAATTQARRDLAALSAISHARLAAGIQDRLILEGLSESPDLGARLEQIASLQAEIDDWLSLFTTSSTSAARRDFTDAGLQPILDDTDSRVQQLVNDGTAVSAGTLEAWQAVLDRRWNALVEFERSLSSAVVVRAANEADRATQNVWIVGGIGIGALLIAGIATALVSRSIVRRVRAVTERAQTVASDQLPALVDALHDPSGEAALPPLAPIRDRGADEIGDLARSFAMMQAALEDVAKQQMETLHRGVAEMFVTLARRNRSLIDRQLALIDQLEAHEDDPATLSDFYRLDHLATRMRRNAESLLVLAGTESHRTLRKPLEIDNVVRASVGEIEDYQRVDILALEALQIRGSAVTDLSHLLSELLENATSFSPPETRVRVAGHFHEDGYLVTVSDRGVGVGAAKLAEYNRLLAAPPVIGLALEPTLGLYVVAMLARRHGIRVKLVPGAPGVTAQVVLPPSMFEPEATQPRPRPESRTKTATGIKTQPGKPADVPSRPVPRAVGEPVASDEDEMPTETGGLPVRRPGTSLLENDIGPPEPSVGSPDSVNEQRPIPASLPTREPGSSGPAVDIEGAVGVSQRDPEALRSAFGAFQTAHHKARHGEEPEDE